MIKRVKLLQLIHIAARFRRIRVEISIVVNIKLLCKKKIRNIKIKDKPFISPIPSILFRISFLAKRLRSSLQSILDPPKVEV